MTSDVRGVNAVPYSKMTANTKQMYMKDVAFLFTKYLMDTGVIQRYCRRVNISDLIYHFLEFQLDCPSFVKSEEIILALRMAHVLRKKISIDDDLTVEFKELVFKTPLKTVFPEDLTKPKVHVFISEFYLFGNKTGRVPPTDGLYCKICNVQSIDIVDLENHLTSDIHVLRNQYRTDKSTFVREIPGLVVMNVSAYLDVGQRNTCVVSFMNTSTSRIFKILKTHVLVDLKEIAYQSCCPMELEEGDKFNFTMDVCFSVYGSYEFPIVTIIEDEKEETIKLLCVPTFRVMKKDVQDLGPVSNYKPVVKNLVRLTDVPFISGEPLLSKERVNYKISLLEYAVPQAVKRIINKGFKASPDQHADQNILKTMRRLLCNSIGTEVLHNRNGLTYVNYVDRFRYLLYIEEHQMNRDMLFYNKNDVELTIGRNRSRYYGLQVPGLSEGRPSILKGDSVFIKYSADAPVKYEGVVHDIQEEIAYLAFNPKFRYIAKQKVNVEFSLNRLPIRVSHRALDEIDRDILAPFFFPVQYGLKPRSLSTISKFRNQSIENNPEQMIAINNIVKNTAYPAPYIIYGPPGTGKTATVVESITQLYLHAENNKLEAMRICACAPSNAAADVIAKRLLKYVPKSAIFRLYGMSVSSRDIPDELKDCSNHNEVKNNNPFPKINMLLSKKIIIVTPVTAGRLHSVAGNNLFDYLFIDEASNIEETISIIPIVGLLKRMRPDEISGSLVLVGDPKQLGPIIHSRLAIHLGLDMSLMERLMVQCPIYHKDPATKDYNDKVITKLLKNYRSHPVLLEVPNELFYDKKLIPAASRLYTDCLSSWEKLPVRDFPLIFHGVRGLDTREANSPSYFNQDEIMQIGEYLRELVNCRIKGYLVRQEDIVILTPYRKQVEKIRRYLGKMNWEKITVSSVEKFQGQEKLIVIISTVRSRIEFLPSDYQFGLGFLRNPKRFNVAVTRAIALMIVIGNPDVLQCDPCWRTLIKYCREKQVYRGITPTTDVNDDLDPNVTLALDLSALTISDEVPESEKKCFPTDD